MIGKFIFYNLQIFLLFIELSFLLQTKIFFRFGILSFESLGKMVKDCYIIALPKEKEIHPVMLPLDGPGLDADRYGKNIERVHAK